MIDTKRFLIGVGLLLLVGAGAHALTGSAAVRGGDGGPASGSLGELNPTLSEGWRAVAELEPERLGSGIVRALDARGDTVVLLQRNRWTVVVGGGVVRGAGSAIRGAHDWIAEGVGIALLEEGIAVLDRGRGEVSVWSAEGERIRAIPLSVEGSEVIEPQALRSDGRATLFVSFRRLEASGEGSWSVVRFAPEREPETLYEAPTHLERWGVHNVPILGVSRDGGLEVAPANEWRVLSFAPHGARRGEWIRSDGPRWAVPDRERREYAALLAQMPEAMRRGLELPTHFPPVRALTGLPGGGWVVLVVAGFADELHAEVIDGEGAPLGRLWEAPETSPVFLAGGDLYRIHERMERTVIERQRIRLSR